MDNEKDKIPAPDSRSDAASEPELGSSEELRLSRCLRCEHHEPPRGKLHCFDWMADIPWAADGVDLVEVQFKNTRKGYYVNSLHLPLSIGETVAVETAQTRDFDIGQITLTGPLVKRRMRHAGAKATAEVKRVLRKANQRDLEKFEEAKAKENDTMIRARKIAEDLKLKMKIGDVEYQGDGNKAIFYYIADERVDFRQLIKVLADTFKVRIEMKQIGARQEAGRIGGIGPCGRPLCCASWMTNFVSVGTAAARFQDISLNPQKLAGQCAKLKCCLNFEVDAYVESLKNLPPKDVRLETADSTWFHFKYDVFNHTITYSTDKSIPANLTTISADRAFEIIAMNKAGEKPVSLAAESDEKPVEKKPYADLLGQDSIARFDSAKKKKKRKKSKGQGGDKAVAEKPEEKSEKAEKTDKSPKAPKPERADYPDRAGGNGNGNGSRRNRRNNSGKAKGNPTPKTEGNPKPQKSANE